MTNVVLLKESGSKVIKALNEAKETLNNAQRWGNSTKNLTSISSFLTIINGTVNDTKYKLAMITLKNAEEEFNRFLSLVQDNELPSDYARHLHGVSLPEEIKKDNFFELSLSDKEYMTYRNQIEDVISSINEVMTILN